MQKGACKMRLFQCMRWAQLLQKYLSTNRVFFHLVPALVASCEHISFNILSQRSIWTQDNWESGHSSHCHLLRIHTAFAIFVGIRSSLVSETNSRGQIVAMPVMILSGCCLTLFNPRLDHTSRSNMGCYMWKAAYDWNLLEFHECSTQSITRLIINH